MNRSPSPQGEGLQQPITLFPYYNARDYMLYPSDEAYLDFLTEVFREVHRVTKAGRFFVLNTSPVLSLPKIKPRLLPNVLPPS